MRNNFAHPLSSVDGVDLLRACSRQADAVRREENAVFGIFRERGQKIELKGRVEVQLGLVDQNI